MSSMRLMSLFAAMAAVAAILYANGVPGPSNVHVPADPDPGESPRATGPGALPSAAAQPLDRPSPANQSAPPPRAGTGAERETPSREELRAMLERTLAGKLTDRELSSSDYERLVDAVLEIRASGRALKSADANDTGIAARNVHVAALRTALVEIEEITGVPPADLGTVLSDSGDLPAPSR